MRAQVLGYDNSLFPIDTTFEELKLKKKSLQFFKESCDMKE